MMEKTCRLCADRMEGDDDGRTSIFTFSLLKLFAFFSMKSPM